MCGLQLHNLFPCILCYLTLAYYPFTYLDVLIWNQYSRLPQDVCFRLWASEMTICSIAPSQLYMYAWVTMISNVCDSRNQPLISLCVDVNYFALLKESCDRQLNVPKRANFYLVALSPNLGITFWGLRDSLDRLTRLDADR